MSLLGGAVGAALLLVLDPAAFRAIVPVLIALGVLLVVLGPRLSAAAARHHTAAEVGWHRWAMMAGVFAAGIYGGYFGAAQGVLLMGIMSTLSAEPLQRLNGYKNVLATAANFIAAVVFVVVARSDIDWLVAALIAVGSVAGGVIGATVGRRLSPDACCEPSSSSSASSRSSRSCGSTDGRAGRPTRADPPARRLRRPHRRRPAPPSGAGAGPVHRRVREGHPPRPGRGHAAALLPHGRALARPTSPTSSPMRRRAAYRSSSASTTSSRR